MHTRTRPRLHVSAWRSSPTPERKRLALQPHVQRDAVQACACARIHAWQARPTLASVWAAADPQRLALQPHVQRDAAQARACAWIHAWQARPTPAKVRAAADPQRLGLLPHAWPASRRITRPCAITPASSCAPGCNPKGVA